MADLDSETCLHCGNECFTTVHEGNLVIAPHTIVVEKVKKNIGKPRPKDMQRKLCPGSFAIIEDLEEE